ncbi:MAG TPA: class I SAM-dependent methyltransferase [Candidatus Limnocylindrales bacterium]|nr:class I SAM-dependent methyltransferase [Candidatus Limnocylindrales bacterium]
MDHRDHVDLIRGGVAGAGPVWADIGAGTGAFTLALADLLGDDARIVAVDRDAAALTQNAREVATRFPATTLTTLVADLQNPLDLPRLDGLLAANSLHFVSRDRQVSVVAALAGHLLPRAPFIVVEYDADRGNPWVPHPFSIGRWRGLASEAGLVDTVEVGRVPSRFLGSIYAAVSRKP